MIVTNEWQILTIDDVPSDILVHGRYQFSHRPDDSLSYYTCFTDCHASNSLRLGSNDIYIRITPQPKTIIKQSGDTWVARHDGKDYIMVAPWTFKGIDWEIAGFGKDDGYDHFRKGWAKIDGIKIVDEIAKLRPMVISRGNPTAILLYGIKKNCAVLSEYNISAYDIRLATVDDL